MQGNPINFDGIVVPSDNPVFLTLIAIHVIAALTCVISGIVGMLSKKQHGQHSRAGTIYFFGLIVVFITVVIISAIRWKEDYHLFILGAISLGSAFVARMAIRQKWNNWQVYHITGMGFSYIMLVTAFYVDNGKFLPVWKDFPTIVYWTLPAVIGIPVTIFTLLRHPIMKK